MFAANVIQDTYDRPALTNPGGFHTYAQAKYAGSGTYYEPTSTTRTQKADFSMEVTNDADATTTVSYQVSLNKFANVSVGGSTELNILTARVNATAEVAAGVSTTITRTLQWNIPQRGVYKITSGEQVVRTSGYLETANNGGVVTSRKFITGEWTTSEFTSLVKIKSL